MWTKRAAPGAPFLATGCAWCGVNNPLRRAVDSAVSGLYDYRKPAMRFTWSADAGHKGGSLASRICHRITCRLMSHGGRNLRGRFRRLSNRSRNNGRRRRGSHGHCRGGNGDRHCGSLRRRRFAHQGGGPPGQLQPRALSQTRQVRGSDRGVIRFYVARDIEGGDGEQAGSDDQLPIHRYTSLRRCINNTRVDGSFLRQCGAPALLMSFVGSCTFFNANLLSFAIRRGAARSGYSFFENRRPQAMRCGEFWHKCTLISHSSG